MRTRRFVPALLAICFSASVALAGSVSLGPGDITNSVPSGAVGGTWLASSSSVYSATGFGGTLYYDVYQNDPNSPYINLGRLTFVYRVAPSEGDVNAINFTTFEGVSTSVAYGGTSGIAPYAADRSPDAGVAVNFNFTANTLLAGGTSSLLIVYTDATQYTTGSSTIIDGHQDTVSIYAPVAYSGPPPVVPLPPAAYAGAALLGMLALVDRRVVGQSRKSGTISTGS